MSEHHSPAQQRHRTYAAEKARQGEIILKEPWQRAIFITGLAGFFLLALLLAFLRPA